MDYPEKGECVKSTFPFDFCKRGNKMDEYKPNSYKSKEEIKDKKIEKIVKGNTKYKKKSCIKQFTDGFIQEDINHVGSYILIDILIPAVKKAISDVVTNGIDMILYGETGRTKKKSQSSNISYRSFYDKDKDSERDKYYSWNRSRSYDDVIIEDRAEAEEVLSRMDELISVYGMVSVADFYELVGINGNYTDNKYGWTDIRSATVVRARGGGYIIKLPKAMPLN